MFPRRINLRHRIAFQSNRVVLDFVLISTFCSERMHCCKQRACLCVFWQLPIVPLVWTRLSVPWKDAPRDSSSPDPTVAGAVEQNSPIAPLPRLYTWSYIVSRQYTMKYPLFSLTCPGGVHCPGRHCRYCRVMPQCHVHCYKHVLQFGTCIHWNLLLQIVCISLEVCQVPKKYILIRVGWALYTVHVMSIIIYQKKILFTACLR